MEIHYWQIVVLGIIQGLAELLPVSSSAHVIAAERLMGLDPSKPEAALLLVILHTGTMLAVLLYFWQRWKNMLSQVVPLLVGTAVTGALGFALIKTIERVFLASGDTPGEIEHLFKRLPLIAAALAVSGLIILLAGLRKEPVTAESDVGVRRGGMIGAVQGLCLPFRGLSRSGATISTGMLLNIRHSTAEEFSFALAVMLTPAAIAYELHKLVKDKFDGSWSQFQSQAVHQLSPGLLGMACSFAAGLLALRWLSKWLDQGRWKFFGVYCLAFACVVLALHFYLPPIAAK